MVAETAKFRPFGHAEDGPKRNKIPTMKDAASQDQDLFEFLTDFRSEMCPADDIFFSGKLLPHTTPFLRKTIGGDESNASFRNRSEPLNVSRGPHVKGWAMRRSFSANYQKLERVSSPSEQSTTVAVQMPKRVSSVKRSGSGDFSPRKISRLKWYFLMLGWVKAPPVEMEMEDIRWRLKRRATAASDDGRQTVAVGRDDEGNRGWKLLQALSCQGQADAVITPSLVVQHARVKAV